MRDIKDRNEHIYLILTRSTVKRLQTVEPPGDVIRNTRSPFYSSTDRHEKKWLDESVSILSDNLCYI